MPPDLAEPQIPKGYTVDEHDSTPRFPNPAIIRWAERCGRALADRYVRTGTGTANSFLARELPRAGPLVGLMKAEVAAAFLARLLERERDNG